MTAPTIMPPGILPIGSCRIHNALIHARDAYGWNIEIEAQYGFVYNTKEIIQQIRHMSGALRIPQPAQRYLDLHRTHWIDTGAGLSADRYFVEISNPKTLEWDGFFPQQNSVYDLLEDAGVLELWDPLWFGDWDDDDAVRERIAAHPGFAAAPPALREFLMTVVRIDQDRGELLGDMSQILRLLGREKVVFLSKATGAGQDGALAPERQRFIADVRDAAAALGAPFLDPTPLLHAFGQDRAFTDGGTNVSHYTPAFEEVLLRELKALLPQGVEENQLR